MTKVFFLLPSVEDPAYICGGWQIFRRAYELVSTVQPAELLTYRHREPPLRYLDDVAPEELARGVVWVTWQSHVTELARRLAAVDRVVLYAQNEDFGAEHGQLTPPSWPIVCLSRYIAAAYSDFEPWRGCCCTFHPLSTGRPGIAAVSGISTSWSTRGKWPPTSSTASCRPSRRG